MIKEKRNLIISLIFSLLIVILELFGLVYSSINQGFTMFLFYTVDSNYFVLISSTIMAIYLLLKLLKNKEIPAYITFLRYSSTICLTLTFIVVIGVLIPMMGSKGLEAMLLSGVMPIHHVICPLLSFISFCFFEPHKKITNKVMFLSLIPTLIYASIVITLNITKTIEGPYPFLMVYNQPIYMSILWVIIILGSCLLIAFLLKIIKNRFLSKSR